MEKEKLEKEKRKAGMSDTKMASPVPNQMPLAGEGGTGGDKEPPPDIIPQILLTVTGRDCPSATELLKGRTLPPLEEVWQNIYLIVFLTLL